MNNGCQTVCVYEPKCCWINEGRYVCVEHFVLDCAARGVLDFRKNLHYAFICFTLIRNCFVGV